MSSYNVRHCFGRVDFVRFFIQHSFSKLFFDKKKSKISDEVFLKVHLKIQKNRLEVVSERFRQSKPSKLYQKGGGHYNYEDLALRFKKLMLCGFINPMVDGRETGLDGMSGVELLVLVHRIGQEISETCRLPTTVDSPAIRMDWTANMRVK